MSLPLLISLFLAALVGVFPAAAPAPAFPASAAVTFAVERAAPADESLTDRAAEAAPPAATPPPATAGTEPAPGHPAVRVLTALNVRAAAAPRAPPLHLA